MRRKRPAWPRVRSKESCQKCGTKYEAFRSAMVPSFAVAYGIMLDRSRAAVEERQDYSKPACLSAVLGYMREMKLRAWKEEHTDWCGMEAKVYDRPDDCPCPDLGEIIGSCLDCPMRNGLCKERNDARPTDSGYVDKPFFED